MWPSLGFRSITLKSMQTVQTTAFCSRVENEAVTLKVHRAECPSLPSLQELSADELLKQLFNLMFSKCTNHYVTSTEF